MFVRAQPSATITTPTDGTVFSEGSSIQIKAIAQTNNDRIDEFLTRMEFYANTTLIGTVVQATSKSGNVWTYDFNWTNPPVGVHSLTARRVSSYESQGSSPPVTIAIGDAGFNIRGGVSDSAGPLYGVRVALSGDIVVDADGNSYITGICLTSRGGSEIQDAFTVKYSPSGELLEGAIQWPFRASEE